MKSSQLALIAALAASVSTPQRAHACSLDAAVPGCTRAQLLLSDSALLPPSAPAIPLFTGAATDFAVTTALGEPVSTQLDPPEGGAALLRFSAALASDTEYRVTFQERCLDPTQPLQPQGTAKSVSFRTSAVAVLPTSLGEVSSEKELGPVDIVDTCGTPTSEKEAAVAELVLRPSVELKPWLPLLTLSASVKDTVYGVGRNVGSLRAGEGELEIGDLTAYCDGSGNVKPGTVTVTVRGRIAGASEDLTAITLDVDLSCAGTDAGISADGGTGFGGPDASLASAKADDGCSLGGERSGPLGLGLPLLFTGALIRRRRTRRG